MSAYIHCCMVNDIRSNFCQLFFVGKHRIACVLNEKNTRMRRCTESLQTHCLLFCDFYILFHHS